MKRRQFIKTAIASGVTLWLPKYGLLRSREAWADTVLFDAQSTAASISPFDSISWSHTVTSGSNLLLLVFVNISQPSSITVSSITYAGQNLTFLDSHVQSTNSRIEVWYKLAPTTGANTVAVTLSGVPGGGSIGGAISFTGVAQTSTFGTVGKGANSDATATATATNAAGGLVVNGVSIPDDTVTITAGGSQTQRYNVSNVTNGLRVGAGENSATGSVSPSWTISIASFWAMMAIPINPATATVPSSPPRRIITQ